MTKNARSLGLPVLGILGLALLAIPRVVLHDLGLIQEGTFVNMLLVSVPVVVWVLVAVAKQVPNPFLTLLAVGATYGLLLGVAHQVFWGVAFGDDPPELGGNLAGLAPGVQEVLFRGFTMISSLFTGVIVGAIAGLVAWAASRIAAGAARS